MKKLSGSHSRRLRLSLIALLLTAFCLATTGCGTIRTHAGIEHEYYYDLDGGGHHHKKHKKHKHHKKHKKHHHHHHDDDDD